MKHIFTLFIITLILSMIAQPIQTVVETKGLVLCDQSDADRMILDGDLSMISILINDSLRLDEAKLINQIEVLSQLIEASTKRIAILEIGE